MEELGILKNINTLTCVSIGCFMGLLFAVGYTASDMEFEIINKDLSQLRTIKISRFLSNYGLDSGKNVMSWLETLLLKKGYNKHLTFGKLAQDTNKNLQVLACNLTTKSQVLFDSNTSPNVPVLRAIRMSMSVPFVFTAKKYKGDYHIDGAVLDNFPMSLHHGTDRRCLGIQTEEDSVSFHKPERFDQYIMSVMACLAAKKSDSDSENDALLVKIPQGIGLTDFDIGNDVKKALIFSGYASASTFFENKLSA